MTNRNLQKIDFQKGVIRSNCIDCLDRTNVFQQLVGEVALTLQVFLFYSLEIMWSNLLWTAD